MCESDIKIMQSCYADQFREVWPLIKAVIGNDNEDEGWKAIIDKTNDLIGQKILMDGEFEKLTARRQCEYLFGIFLYNSMRVVENMNKQLKLWDGESGGPYHTFTVEGRPDG